MFYIKTLVERINDHALKRQVPRCIGWPHRSQSLECGPLESGKGEEWSGAYAGVAVGYAAGDDQAQEINGPRDYIADFGGAAAAGYVGWQNRVQSVIAGLELEGGYLNLSSDVTRDVAGGQITSGSKLGAYAAFPGRLGVLIDPATLIYGRAGIAIAQLDGRTVQTCTDAGLCGAAQSTPVSNAETSDVSVALVLGGGVEHELNRDWTARLDYQFMNFRDELALPPIDGPGWTHEDDVHALKAGLSYRF
jgi:outer membrane immunogenic protein